MSAPHPTCRAIGWQWCRDRVGLANYPSVAGSGFTFTGTLLILGCPE